MVMQPVWQHGFSFVPRLETQGSLVMDSNLSKPENPCLIITSSMSTMDCVRYTPKREKGTILWCVWLDEVEEKKQRKTI